MTFIYPLGLLGLIAVPILIVIYILQSKFTEQTVPSTYLWHLSEKFLKRRNPLSGLTGIISLILQILTVILVSLAIARPVFTLPGAAKDYHFILDASSSMTMTEGKKTRFELAKDKIEDVIDGSADGSTYSLTLVSGDEVVLFNGVRDKDSAIEIVNSAEPNNTALSHEDLLSSAQRVFDANTSTLVYVVTDRSYAETQNLELITVGSADAENYAVSELEYSHAGSRLTASANVVSYVSDRDLEVRLVVDGREAERKAVAVKKNEAVPVELSTPIQSFESVSVEIVTKDGYAVDNTVTAHNLEADKSYSVLIVSERGFFFEAAIDALLNSEVKVIDPDVYEKETGEYGLYIFDGYSPSELPRGSVWLVNCDKNIEKSGFDVRARVTLPEADVIERSSSTATAARALLEGVSGEDIYISEYVKYSGMYLKFSTLFSYEGNPLVFAGTNGVGSRQVVFGFDLHESDFALSVDFITLLENLLAYSFPDVVDKGSYTVGEEAIINILSNAEGYRAKAPSGKDVFIDDSSSAAAILLDEVGTYTVFATVSGKEVPYKIFSGADPEESRPVADGGGFVLSGEPTFDSVDGELDPITVLLVCLAVLFIADWGVYCYEKYQLR